MPKITLNDKAALRAPPAVGQVELWDKTCPGFGLRIAAGGARTYFVMKRVKGKLLRRTVGKHPPPSTGRDAELPEGFYWPAQARVAAQLMLAQMAIGSDPAPRHDTTPAERDGEQLLPGSFGRVAASYLADPTENGAAALRSLPELTRMVKKDLAVWKDRPIAEITRKEVKALLAIKRETARIGANRLRSVIARIFAWAEEEELVEDNVAVGIKPTTEKPRERVLAPEEIARVWAAADGLGYPYGPFVKLLILTAQRKSEVSEMRWAEINGAEWLLPSERAKRGKEHLVPLSPLAVAIVEKLPRLDKSELVFSTGKRRVKKGEKVDSKAPPAPISGWSRFKARIDKAIAAAEAKRLDEELDTEKHALAGWTLHDIRRSVATHLRDEKTMGKGEAVDRSVVSKLLNHAEGGMTGRVYDRFEAQDEKRKALEAWAKAIERLCGLNVVPMKAARVDA